MNSAHQRQHADAACCGSGCATVPVAPEPTASDATTIGPQRFRIENMDCASEESEIRRALEGMAGIRSLRFNLGDRELAIAADDHALPEALEAIRKAGFKPEPLGAKNVQRFRIANMDCASEESEIRRALDGMAGIRSLQFNLGERELAIAADDPVLQQALDAIRKAGFKPEPLGDTGSSAAAVASPTGFWTTWGKSLGALGLAVAAEGLAFAFPDSVPVKALGMALAAAAIALSGFSVYGKGLAALRQGRLNINALMTVAVTGAFLIGQWPEAAMVMALYAIAEAIEARAVDRARGAIKSLLALAPEQAEVRQDDGNWVRMGVKEVTVGMTVRIRPGERVPLDGIVSLGQSAIDQSPVTGESLPVDKSPGDEVFAGTINQAAALEIRVTAPASDSTLARIIHAVEQAQSSRAPTQRFVDRFAAVYTPAVFVLAVAVALLAPWLMGLTWMQAAYKALVLLVIACPCALVISTPVTVVSGLAAGARRGILIKGGVYLEEARKIKAVALDKTGTITEGKPKLVAFEPVDTGLGQQALEGLAKSLAARSDHPVSKAIADGVSSATQEVDEFQAVAGRGVQGVIDGHTYVLANHRWIEERGQCSADLEARLAVHEQAGRTVTLLASSERVMAICAVADTIKSSSAQAVADLKALGVTPVMLTGDNLATAQTVGTQAGIAEVRGNLLPEDKLQAIGELQQRMGVTATIEAMEAERLLLIVEDDAAFARTLGRSFERRGYRTLHASTLQEMQALLKEHQPAYAVIDLKLNGDATGLACVQQLHQQVPEALIVVLTGFASIATAVEAIKLGACHYLAKPSNTDDIEAAFGHVAGSTEVELTNRSTSIKTLEWERIHETLAETGFNISETARRLGMHRRTLARKLEKQRVK